MGRRLTDNLNSRYIEAANRLKPSEAKKRVVAYVESYDDVFFWRSVLDELETDKVRFEVMLPSRTNLGKGKKTVLTNELGPRLGECMIACVDADYDWLMQGRGPVSDAVVNNPYVFHTYVYAIENYQCYAPGLHNACVMATLNDREVMNLTAFMEEYSRIVWPLFVWSVWMYREERYKEFSLLDFCGIVTFHDISPYHPERALEWMRSQVNRKMAALQKRYPQAKTTYPQLRDELLALGLTPETTYLYIQGHSVFEGVTLPLLTPICKLLRKERESEINQLACHQLQKQNELSCYQHSQSPIDLMLRKSTSYHLSAPFRRLQADLREFVDKL
ncbi:MAG: DUF4435 domain-containing protein [Bacteroidaceae bacterium]|nr:DUF4435 domain-containing protein [Bacteroidaceae bacterium]